MAVNTVIEAIIMEWDGLFINWKSLIKDEIEEAIKTDSIGDNCDKFEWQKILKLEV